MPQSDSEGFESADEGTHESSIDNKVRKKRYSSSNYSDSAQDSDQISKEQAGSSKNVPQESVKKQTNTDADGWDDFDIDDNETITQESCAQKIEPKEKKEMPKKEQDTGWDDFDDWGQDAPEVNKTQSEKVQSPDIKSVADRLASVSAAEQKSGGGWGWSGWGVDSLLNTATAGISTITNHVSQGINTVLETGIGAPDPEELARIKKAQAQAASQEASKMEINAAGQTETTAQSSGDDGAFQLGNLLSGVTKFVESTGTKVIAGGLDTLETIGKKTMEVLQDGDPGLAKKRAMFGLDSGDKPVLSQVLKEAKAKADEEDKLREEKREAKEVHYETLFDDFEGLVHLEALEMLSREVSMRIEERLRGIDDEKRQEVKETLQQVAELCELSEEDEEESEAASSGDELHQRLHDSVRDLGVKLHFTEIVKVYGDILESLASEESVTEKALYKQAVSALAAYSAKGVRLQLCAAQNLLLAARRSTADEADALTQMTIVLTKHVSELAARFTTKLNSIDTSNKEQINNYITNVFLEAENSTTYIQNAFQLTLPILQIGAV